MKPRAVGRTPTGAGLLYALAAYVTWGLLPVYFYALQPTGPIEVVSWRVVGSLVLCALLVQFTVGWRTLGRIVRNRRSMGLLALASALIGINWLIYVYAVHSENVLQASLGYFLNPIITVAIGVLLLRERLRSLQWVAVGISVVAAVVLTVGNGSFPWISFVLATSFAIYGLVKKQVGEDVDSISGLTVETAILTPLAVAALVVLGLTTGLTFGTQGTWHTILLLAAGVVTAVPLMWFAAGARRLPLVYMGLVQYASPVLQFLVGVVILHEPMPLTRWIGFAIVWVALIVLTVDMFLHGTRQRTAALAATSEARP